MNISSITLPYSRPAARADMRGSTKFPALYGHVDFYPCRDGTAVTAEMWGLPYDCSPCAPNICAMHIHTSGSCAPMAQDSFTLTGGHYDPDSCPHPAHAGDMPPLFSNRGYAYTAFYTERFSVKDIIGRAVIIHSNRDDFTSQPAGDAGERIGCGTIRSV